MAAYAALTSVMYILQQIQHHPRPPITVETQQMVSLCEYVSFLQDFLEKHSHRDIGDGKEALESQIANAAYAAEDVIESHIVHQILAQSNFHKKNNFIHLFSRGFKKMIRTLAGSPSHKTEQILTGDRERSFNSLFCQDLQKVIEDMNLIKKEVMKIQEKIMGINDDQLPTNIIPMSANIIGSSTAPPPKWKNTNTNTMVGFDDALIEIMDRLTGYPTNLQVLPIVGMGGIDPPNVPLIQEGDDDDFILRYLHTLKSVRNFKLSEEVIKRIPNIKKLQVEYCAFGDNTRWWHDYCLNNLGLLNKLESLYIKWSDYPTPSSRIELLQNIAFPHSLKKLTLVETQLLWEDMRMIGSLPHLQVLILRRNSFCGPEWNPVEGEFLSLKFLKIEWCDELEYWNANRTHFPCLEKLVLVCLKNLKEIPLVIGQISTLQFIELSNCMDSVAISAKNLLDEQVELGNEGLKVRVVVHLQDTQVERLASHNFQVETHNW